MMGAPEGTPSTTQPRRTREFSLITSGPASPSATLPIAGAGLAASERSLVFCDQKRKGLKPYACGLGILHRSGHCVSTRISFRIAGTKDLSFEVAPTTKQQTGLGVGPRVG